jgi:CzcA family heavy metal efflux pump
VNAIIVWSVRNRGLVAALAIVWLFLGAAIARRAPLDVFPEFVPPQVTIQAEAPGFAPEQVEQIVTKPIEDAVNGTQGLDTMRSESVDGLSVVTLTFAEGADPINVRQGIAEKLTTISGTLPTGVAQPTLSPLTSSTMDVLKIGLVSDTVDPFELRDLARWVLKPQLLAVPGIARVSIFGGAVRQIHIEPKIDRLTALGLTIADVVTASRQSLALRGAGFIDTGPQRVTLEASTPVPDPHALAATLVTTQNGVPIRLGDVSTVTMAPALELGDAVVQGRKGVLLTISGQYGENTLAATQGLEARLGELTPILEKRGITVYPALHRPATFVERALANLEGALALGGLLILIVLYAFLRNFRAVLISFVTIPLSLFAAIAVLTATGQTLNTMTLGGFAVALGVLVDDAIIDIENIMRRLRQSANQNAEDRLTTIEDASIEIRGSMLYGTLAVILVFLPVLFAGGVQGRFVAPMAVAFVLAVVASLVVAVTVTPALCALLIRYQDQHAEAAWIARVKRWHVAAMAGVQRAWILLVVLLAALATGAAARLPYLESELIPPFREGHFVLQVSTVTAGTSLDEMVSLGERISAQLLALPFVATVEQQIGRAEAGEDTWTTDRSEFHVELTPHHDVSEDEAQEQIRGILERIPEVSSETLTFLGDRISESISGETAQVVVNVTGNDLAAIEHSAADIGAALTSIPGLRDLQIPKIEGTPTLSLRLDTVKLTSYGLSQQDALDSIQTAFSGATVGQTYAGSRTVDVVVILPPGSRNRLETLDNLMLGNLSARLPLRKIASIKVSEGRANIQRRSGVRRAAVTFNASGRPLQDVVSDARARAGSVQLPNDVYVEFTGQAEAEREGQLRFAGLTLLASVLIVLVMTRAFQRRWLAAFVLVNVPFCLLGSIAAIDSTHIGLTLGSLVGLVVVFGIGARNSIMLLAHAEHLVDREGFQPTRATIERAASERFVPVVMTALMAALGLVPLALGLGLAGHEIEAPMAIAVLGGLFASTFLNLVVLPELAVRLGPQVGLMRESEV